MATMQKITEGVFLISWTTNRISFSYGHSAYTEASVNIDEMFLSCRLSFSYNTGLNMNSTLVVYINPFTIQGKDKNVNILKPTSVLAIMNGSKHAMQLNNSKWTSAFTLVCACGQQTTQCKFDILINFNLNSMKKESNCVLNHLLNLWETKTLADVTFKLKAKEVKAHTLILASGSPVLAAMFQNDFKEKLDKVVIIKDIKSTVFEKMLRYIYIGDANLDKADVADLMIVADKYGVDSLKKECSLYMAENLTVENVICYLVVSHLHESPNLYKAALEFISKNSEAIVSRKDWVDLMKNYHELSLAAVQMMVLAKK